ncbi:MAG: hypothetical protein Q7K45_07535, partial [Nanoarchaeota archaeon]|nr:hypothetical protein [Nanoarchaeota archaeon]
MADEDRNRRRLQRVQQLKAQDSTMTSSKALDIMRREEADAERAAKATEAAERARQREAEEERRAAKEQEKASKETEKAERERGKAAKEDITKDKEDINNDKQEENVLKKLTNKNSDDGSQSSTSTDSGAYTWVSVALIFIGLAEYLLRISTAGLSSFAFGLSLLLFLLSGLAIAHFAQKDKITILIPMLLFVVWYFFFNGNYAPGFLISFLPVAFVILLIPILFSKGQSTAPELLGLVPVLFFFLDIGLIPFLVENLRLSVTPLLQSLVLFMPWWTLLGIFTLPGTASKSTSVNFFLNFLRIAGVFYIVVILIAPAIPGLGLEKSLLPGKGDFEAAQQRLRTGIPQQENPAWSNLVCIFSEPTGVQSCVDQRQELSELTYICEKVESKEKGTPQFTQCLEEQRKKKKSASLQVQGVIDPTIKEPTKAQITINKESFPTTYNAQFPFPFELNIENPRK